MRGQFTNVRGWHSVHFRRYSLFHSLKLFYAEICFLYPKCVACAWPVSKSEWPVRKCAWPSLKIFTFFSILGKMVVTPTADPHNPNEEFEGLETKAVEVLGQFSLELDDPANYTDRFTFMQQRREWPGKRYPPGADLEEDPYGRVSQLISAQQSQPQGATGGPVPSTSGAGTSVAPVPSLPPPAQSVEGRSLLDMKKGLIQYHHDLVRMCAKADISDVCAKNKETRVENILKGLSSDDLSCKICKKPYSNTTHLRNHIKMKHLKKTPFFCAICKKYFTDQSTLNDHNRKHDPDAKKYKCMQCPKEFFSKSKLNAFRSFLCVSILQGENLQLQGRCA